MLATLQKISSGKFPLFSRWVWGAVIILSNVAAFAQIAPDADLYYRRTHDGEWPATGINPSDHSGETTNVIAAATSLPPLTVRPKIILDNGVDPANLGKGDWIWQVPTTISHLGLAAGNVQGMIDYEKNLGVKWITVKCGDGGNIWSQFNADLITRAHAAGLKIFGWAYAYGNNASHYGSSSQSANINGEINVALNSLALGADGFIIDAETEYETNPTRVADATLYAGTIKSNYPTRFLAHAPFPYINSHSGFPYIQFGIQCDAVMPQDYWGAIGISPQTMVINMNTQWRNWQNGLTGNNTNAIKPIIPIGQSYAPVTGAQITAFLYALQTNSPKATLAGYNSVSFWDAQERNADMDAAIRADGAPYVSTQPLNLVADTGGNANFVVNALGTAPLYYQWQFNGTNVPGATTNYLFFPSAQLTNAGNYICLITNLSGSATSSIVALVVYPVQATVFADAFETNSASNWIVNQSSGDTAVAFNFDYSTLGIPSAPHSAGGTTRGVQMKANLALSTVAALSLSPLNQNFSGDYRLHFDGWINVNGPFPGGGASSTEFLTAGIGTAGNQTEWTGSGSAADGFYFSADGDGGVSTTSTTSGDYSGYMGTVWQNTASGIYAAGASDNANVYYQTAFPSGLPAPALQQANYPQQTGTLNTGTLGFAWHDIIVSRRGSTVSWSVDGILLATITNATFTANNVSIGFWDPFASLTDNTNLSFSLVDNVRVEVPAVAPVITTNPSPQTVKLGTNVTFTAAATGLPTPAFQWQFNGTNILGATNASFTLMNVQTTSRGNYSVMVTNIAGSTGSPNVALALLPAVAAQFQSITAQPNDSLQISFGGDTGWNYTVEVSTNLINWSVLTNLTSADGSFNFTAGSITNSPQQFYRVRVGP